MASVALSADAGQIDIPGPGGSGAFGTTVTVLPNGNIVVTDPNGPVSNVGAVYLYGPTGVLISSLTGGSANDHGVVVALEDWISAEDNIKIVDAIGSDYVGVYYDCHNIVPRVKDIYVEPKMLGKRIHQIHVKNANILLSQPGGRVDWPRMAQEFHDIGYRGWYVLETGAPSRDIVANTRANIEYVKKTFRMPPAR